MPFLKYVCAVPTHVGTALVGTATSLHLPNSPRHTPDSPRHPPDPTTHTPPIDPRSLQKVVWKKEALPSDMQDLGLLIDDFAVLGDVEHSQTISVELKVGCGFVPPPLEGVSWVKSLVGPSALRRSQSEAVSQYDPLDLFSGNFDRIRSALSRLLDTPQDDVRVFRYGRQLQLPKYWPLLLVPRGIRPCAVGPLVHKYCDHKRITTNIPRGGGEDGGGGGGGQSSP